ncbi:MAG: hypothetical protein DLM50_09425 [Candidatus Meridianibacter frigidus]|nr:MAG: hypothetical protein DLM50_09425 [Candidatus Eremiobacteraeota bacterium]
MFEILRPESLSDVPPQDDRALDLALLDMHHGWPNVGHDAIVTVLRELAAELCAADEIGLRVIAFDVRDRMLVPQHDGRFQLYVGTGGPGHLDPRENRGRCDAEIEAEDPSWETPLFSLFDAIAADRNAALLGVCHTFGLLCRWAGIARPLLRSEKRGKSTGVQHNTLSEAAAVHPWFSRLANAVGRAIPVVDSRYYDLVALAPPPPGVCIIASEDSEDGEVYTMVEFARNPGDDVPRIFASNHHPEIPDAETLRRILAQKVHSGEVTPSWHDERAELIAIFQNGTHDEAARLLTARYAFNAILRTHLERLLALKSEGHGSPVPSAL